MPKLTSNSISFVATNSNTQPVAGALLTVFAAGTTNVVTTYADAELTTPNPSPVVANASGKFPVIYVTGGQLYKVDMTTPGGVSLPGYPEDNVRVEFANVQPANGNLTALADLTLAANEGIYATSAEVLATYDLTPFARTLLDDADAATARATLGAAPLASPALTGTPTVPTATTGTDTTQAASTAFVQQEIAASPPDYVFIEEQTFSNDATADFTGFDAAIYGTYVFCFANVIPATDTATLWARTSTDGGAAYSESGTAYSYAFLLASSAGGGALSGASANANAIAITNQMGGAANEDGFSGTVTIVGPDIAKRTQVSTHGSYYDPSGNFNCVSGGGVRRAQEEVNAVRFLFSSGDIESGTIAMYGIRNS